MPEAQEGFFVIFVTFGSLWFQICSHSVKACALCSVSSVPSVVDLRFVFS